MSGKRYGNLEYRAKRYVLDVHHYGYGFSVAQKETKLPERLAMAIRIIFFGNREGKSDLPMKDWKDGIDLAINEYRSYYRERAARKQLAAG